MNDKKALFSVFLITMLLMGAEGEAQPLPNDGQPTQHTQASNHQACNPNTMTDAELWDITNFEGEANQNNNLTQQMFQSCQVFSNNNQPSAPHNQNNQ